MKILKTLWLSLFLLMTGAVANVNAQDAVTAGSQVTDIANIVSGKAYLLQHQGNGTNAPWIEDKGTFYNCPNSAGNCNTASVWYLLDNGDGTWKIKNAYTGKFWPTPTENANLVGTDAANAGNWALNLTNGVAAPTCNGYRLNRNTPYLVGWNSGSGTVTQMIIYEVALSTVPVFDEFIDKEANVESTAATSLTTGTWYVMKNVGRNVYAYEKTDVHKLYNQSAVPSGLATENAEFLVRLVSGSDGKYYIQNGIGNYFGAIPQNTAVPTTALPEELISITQIGDNAGYFYLRGTTDDRILDCQDPGYPVVGWGTDAPTVTNSNGAWQFFPVTLVDSWVPAINEVYTINNTNTNRGALIYNPSASTKYVWSSGKGGTFDASSVNSQWVIIPTAVSKQYYLYNVGAGKFAIPTNITNGAEWIFSDNAVALIFETQGDGTKKIKMATAPISGTNAAYVSVSNGKTNPIINYNDAGSCFTIAKIDGQDQSTAANAALAKLVSSQTALTGYPQSSGWYAIQIKSKTGAAAYAGRFLQAASTLYNGLYPLTFTGGVDVQPAITDPTFLTHIDYTSWEENNWQLSDGRYLVKNANNKFPTVSATPSAVIMGYDNGNFFKSAGNWFADPYNNGTNYFVGETSSFRTIYNVYPVDLSAAGLTAWQMVCDNAPDETQISCSRSDICGSALVYKGGYIFLPSGVTPENTDFALEGASDVTVDAVAHTVTFAYDPNLAILEGNITVAQGWQTAGRGEEVKLLRVTAKPFKDATNVTLTVSLLDGSEANISALTLYEADSASPEVLGTGEGAPTLTPLATAAISGSTATLEIGNLAVGTHYYWIGATVKDDATVGAVIDASVSGITYTCNENVTNLYLTAVGNPSDRGAMVFNVHSYPFLPRDNGSRVYRIPAMIVADDGSIVVAADKRYDSYTDIGNGGHVIDIVIRRSTDGGKTWGDPVTIAKGLGSTATGGDDNRCGYGDPSLVKGKDGKLYCLFAAGNLGYFYGQKGLCMSTSDDNGVTWSSSTETSPTDLYLTGAIKNVSGEGAAGGYGLYDYFVTSGRGLYTTDGILMYLIPAQTLTAENYSTITEGTRLNSSSDDYIFYSTDDGATWYFSPTPMFTGGDEAKVIQTGDGRLLGSVRQSSNRGFCSFTYTVNGDGTLSFNKETQWNNPQLSAGGAPNNQDIFYYQRQSDEGKTDLIIHSMTTGQHANFKLYYSTDQGANWTEFLTVQTKGTRYVTMDKNPANGSLYLFFEDQSLNSAGGYTDYNHYPLNFIEVTRDQLAQLIPALDEYAKPEYLDTKDVKIVSGLTGEAALGSWSGSTWTSASSGLTLTLSDGLHDKFSNYNGRYNMAYHPAEANTNVTLTLTAPEGYIITGYSVETGVFQAQTYTLTPEDGTPITPANLGNTYTPLAVTGLSTTSTAITVTTTDASKWLCLANFTVTLAKPIPLNRIGDASYATLYLPYDATTDGSTKAYYIKNVENGYAMLTATSNEGTEIPAHTAVILINGDAAQNALLSETSGLPQVVGEDANCLKGTLTETDINGGYVLNGRDDEPGFFKLKAGKKLAAYRAYLPADVVGNVKGVLLNWGDADGQLTIDNGQLTMVNGKRFDLSGRRVADSQLKKGIYIVNSKKVVIK